MPCLQPSPHFQCLHLPNSNININEESVPVLFPFIVYTFLFPVPEHTSTRIGAIQAQRCLRLRNKVRRGLEGASCVGMK